MTRRIGSLDNHSEKDLARVRKMSGFFKDLFHDPEQEEIKRLNRVKWSRKLDRVNPRLFTELGISKKRLQKVLEILDDEGIL